LNILNKTNWLIVVFITAACLIYSDKSQASTTTLGEKIERVKEIYSVSINDHLSIDIYIPDGIGKTDQRYPTIYVMDGQHYFHSAIAFQKSLRNRVNASPKFIVVGLNTEKLDDVPRGRYNLYGTNTNDTIELFEKKIIPYIDKNYPTNKTRMFFGWQFAAGFGLDLFSKRPNLIEGYFLASSPTFTKNRISRTSELLSKSENLNNYFYLSLGETETHATNNHQRLDKLFQQHEKIGIKSRYNLSEKYNHQTTPLDSFSNGLEWYFSDYPDITFYSVDEIQEFGGISAIKAYYQKRGARYQISTKVGEQAKFSMFRHAAQANEWELFQEFEKEMGEYMPSKTTSEGWYHLYGNFYIKNSAFAKAEKLYQQAVEVYPASHKLWSILGDVAEKQDKLTLAVKNYRNALANANQQDEEYSKYKEQVKRLSKSLDR